jgi:hypothetical protein
MCGPPTCGVRVMDGEVDFLTCAVAMDRLGGTLCEWTTHELRGKDIKKCTVIKMDLPVDSSAYAIPVSTTLEVRYSILRSFCCPFF